MKGLGGLAIAALALALVQDSYQQLPISCSPGQTELFDVSIPPFNPGDTIFSSNCSSLRDLRIKSFPQTTFPAGFVDPLTELRELRLINIGLEAIETNAFSALGELRLLGLEENPLTSVDGIFDGLSNLKELYVEYSPISTIPAGVFQNLGSLTFLSLVNLPITSIDADAFDGLTNLDYLIFNTNTLTTLPEGLFQDLGALETLELVLLNLDTLPFDLFAPLTAFDFGLFFSGLNLECSPPLPSGSFLVGPPPCNAPPPSLLASPPPPSPAIAQIDVCFDLEGNTILPGDFNQDGSFTVSDVVALVAIINGL